jgi:hypothetical protein
LWQPPDVDAAVDLASVFSAFEEPWSPRTVAVLNNYDVRGVKTAGEFTATAILIPTSSSSCCAGR